MWGPVTSLCYLESRASLSSKILYVVYAPQISAAYITKQETLNVDFCRQKVGMMLGQEKEILWMVCFISNLPTLYRI